MNLILVLMIISFVGCQLQGFDSKLIGVKKDSSVSEVTEQENVDEFLENKNIVNYDRLYVTKGIYTNTATSTSVQIDPTLRSTSSSIPPVNRDSFVFKPLYNYLKIAKNESPYFEFQAMNIASDEGILFL
jgi:hypothetical protein